MHLQTNPLRPISRSVRLRAVVILGGIALWAGIFGACLAWQRSVVLADIARKTKVRHPPILDRTTTYSTVNPAATSGPDFLQAEVDELPEQMWSVTTLSAFLRERGFRVCSEELPRRYGERPLMFWLSNEPRTLRQLLDDAAFAAPSYRWDFVTGSQMINVVPRNSRLDVPLQVPSRANCRLIDCIEELRQPCQLTYGVFYRGNFRDPGRIEHWPFQVRASNLLARDYLNQLAGQYDGMSWYVTSGKSVYFEVNPPDEYDRVAEKLRADARARDDYLRQAIEADSAP